MISKLNVKNNASTILVNPMSAVDVNMIVEDQTALPVPPFLISIDDEILLVTNAINNTLTVERGYEGTAPAPHEIDSKAENRFTAGTLENIYAMIGDLSELATYDKSSLVNAINEVIAKNADLVPPQPVTGLSYNIDERRVTINFTPPTDEDFTFVKLVYKVGSMPESPNDGTVLFPFNSGTTLDLDHNTEYYFRLYPYDVHNNWNSTLEGQSFMHHVMNEAPDPVTNLTAVEMSGNTYAVTFDIPTNYDFVGVRAVYKLDGMPEHEEDGTIIDNFISGTILEAPFYIRLFPYDDLREYNRTSLGQALQIITGANIWGFRWNMADPSPVLTRTFAAAGLTREAVTALCPCLNLKRCLLLDDGTVNYYLNPNDSSLKEDGSPAVLDGTDGQVMVEVPKFYYKVDYDSTTKILDCSISADNLEGYSVHPAFFRDRDGDAIAEEVDFRYYAAFKGHLIDNKLCSVIIPDTVPSLLVRQNWTGTNPATGAITYAANRGQGWNILDFKLWYAIQILYCIEYANLNSQEQIGMGSSSTRPNGWSLFLGNNTGQEVVVFEIISGVDLRSVSFHGIEGIYGNGSEYIYNIYMSGDVLYIDGVALGSANDNGLNPPYVFTNSFKAPDYMFIPGSYSGGYPVGGGSSVTYVCDSFRFGYYHSGGTKGGGCTMSVYPTQNVYHAGIFGINTGHCEGAQKTFLPARLVY